MKNILKTTVLLMLMLLGSLSSIAQPEIFEFNRFASGTVEEYEAVFKTEVEVSFDIKDSSRTTIEITMSDMRLVYFVVQQIEVDDHEAGYMIFEIVNKETLDEFLLQTNDDGSMAIINLNGKVSYFYNK